MINCVCKFVAIGVPVDNKGCEVHNEPSYACDDCNVCKDYRPSKVCEPSKGEWPLCVCGHIAQAHNS